MRRKIIFILLLSAFSVSLTAQKKRESASVLPALTAYCLPQVSFVVQVKLECVKQIPGPYYAYAEKSLGIKPEISEEKEHWRLVDLTVTPQFFPDKKAIYTLTGSGESDAIRLSLSPEGFLAGVSAKIEGTASHLQNGSISYKAPEVKRGKIDVNMLSTHTTLKEVLDSNYLHQEIDGVMKKIWDPIIRYEVKNEQDNLGEAVKVLFRIRSERARLLLSDEDKPDAELLKVLLREFDALEKEYMSLFFGKEEKREVSYTFICTPEKAGEAVPVFRLSESKGIADKKDVSAVLYSLVADRVVIPGAEQEMPQAESAAIYYRIPATADVKLMKLNEELIYFRTLVPQLGTIATFPLDVISNEKLTLLFHPEYGSLKSIQKH
ncbi:DUF4831 family protein [Odoribacter sp. OttesenSCG-928-J03]|nr:DUF4831 family protein [Odoribacter sp. OttesenSCG-928-J03]MDL2330418.1 DUF4831 family protein [Odoribacter sp. OttesenSCG-928-A06]